MIGGCIISHNMMSSARQLLIAISEEYYSLIIVSSYYTITLIIPRYACHVPLHDAIKNNISHIKTVNKYERLSSECYKIRRSTDVFFESTVFCRIMSDFVFAGQMVKFNTSKLSGCSPFGC